MHSNDKVWIPPGMRVCTWDEAQWAVDGGYYRLATDGNQTAGWARVADISERPLTWLCIDTKSQHTHADKPWAAMGFEKCSAEEAPKDETDGCVATWSYRRADRRDVPLRPSPLLGLKRALEILTEFGGNSAYSEEIRREIAKYEPPVCGECGRVK